MTAPPPTPPTYPIGLAEARADAAHGLTARQRQLLDALIEGRDNKGIAGVLCIDVAGVVSLLRRTYAVVPSGDAPDPRVATAVWWARVRAGGRHDRA